MTSNLRLLCIEDNPVDAMYLQELFKVNESSFSLVHTDTLSSGLRHLGDNHFDALILDLGLPDSSGLDTLETVVTAHPSLPVIVLTGLDESDSALQAMKRGAQDFADKRNIEVKNLVKSINYAIYRKQSERALQVAQNRIENLSHSASDAIFIIDQQGTILYANPAAMVLMAADEATLLGSVITDGLNQATSAVLNSLMKLMLTKSPADSAVLNEGSLINRSGTELAIEYTVGHWPTETGDNYSLFIRDVSERKLSEKKVWDTLEVQKAIAQIQGQRGQTISLSEKLNNALQAILTVAIFRSGSEAQAGIYLEQQDKEPVIVQQNITVSAEEYQSVRNHPFADKPFSFYQHTNDHYWFLLAGNDGVLIGYFILAGQPVSLAHSDTIHQLQLVLSTLSSMIEDHRHGARIAQLSQAVEQSPSGIVLIDGDCRIRYVNKALSEITGYEREELLSQESHVFKSELIPKALYDDLWSTIKSGSIWRGEVQNRRKNGERYWESVVVAPVEGGNIDETYYIAIKENIEQRKRDEQELIHMATHDPLTGLPNRTLLLDRLKQALAQARREGKGVTALLLDLDHFSLVNDQHGHQVGDDLLRIVAGRLKSELRATDTVGRQGGDEFVIILPCTSSNEAVQLLVDKILAAVSRPCQLGNFTTQIYCSVGVSICSDGNTSSENLYRQADIAMYQAKKMGGCSSCFFDEEMDVYLNSRIWFRSAMKEALGTNQLRLYYQPQINTKTGYLTGTEALIRWIHPEKGFISPADFIPLAEETGYIVDIGDWVIQEVCRQIRRWLDAGLNPPRTAINLSAHQLTDENLVAKVVGEMKRFSIDPDFLEVELTESSIMESPERAIKLLEAFRERGIHVSGDDFGTGYSSLSHLKRLPLDMIKIDRSFISDITTDQDSHAIASMIIALGHNLGLKVLAEGVEDLEQLKLLTRLGCDEFQGYLCSPAIPADEFAAKIKDTKKLVDVGEDTSEERVLLLIDHDSHVLQSLHRLFSNEGYRILKTDNPQEAYKLLAEHEVGVILCDQSMPVISGTEFLSNVKAMHPSTVRMILSGYTEMNNIIEAVNQGYIYKFLMKPWDDGLLRKHIDEAFQFHEMKRTNTN